MYYNTSRSQIIGSFITAIVICFAVIGMVLSTAYFSEKRVEFNPLPYSLGSAYDADTMIGHSTMQASQDTGSNRS